ncbi:MAG: hypothetical protein RLZZ621_1172 [Gemmatimonadota bacterium]
MAPRLIDSSTSPVASASPSASTSAPAASRHAWYAVAILTLANVSGFIDRQILAPLVEPIRRDLQISDTQISLLGGLGFALFYSVLGIPIGRWVDRGHRPRIVALGVAVWSLLTALSASARSFGQLFLARIGVGVGEATLGPAAVSLIAEQFPRQRLGIAMSTYMVGTFAGSGLAYAIGAYLVQALDRPGYVTLPLIGDVHPWQTVFLWVGLPGLFIALLALTMREPRLAVDRARRTQEPPFADVLRYVRTHARTIGGLSMGYALSASVNYGIAFWLAAFLIRTHGWTVGQAGLLQGVLTSTLGVAGVLFGGRLTDRWNARGMVDAPLRVGMLGAVGMLVCAGLYPVMPNATWTVVLLLPVNVFATMPWGAANAAIAEAMPSHMRGQGSAIYQLVVNLVSGVLGPTAVAVVTDTVFGDPQALGWSLSLNAVFGMSAVLALLAWTRPAYRATVERVRAAEGDTAAR